MPDYLPRKHEAFEEWLKHFAGALAACGAEIGVSPEEIAKIQGDATRFGEEVRAAVAANNAYRAVVVTRDDDRKDTIEPYVRQLVKRIQAYPKVTDAIRYDLDIPVPGKKRAAPERDVLEAAGKPLLVVEFGLAKRAMLKFGKNPYNQRENGKPAGIRGVRIWQYAGDKPPVKDEDWRFLDESSRSPYVHVLMNSTPLTISYRVAYVDHKNRAGIPSEPVTVTINA